MSQHDVADSTLFRFIATPAWRPTSASVAARAPAEAEAAGVSCRLGDASCASAHAARVSRWASPGPESVQRSLLRLQRDHGNQFVGQVLRQADAAGAAAGDMDTIERSIDGARGAGQGLDHGTRTQMESAFGADFSGVRIHADTRADGLSQALSARAFTTGRDVFFRQGEYSPGTTSGRELLAHELTHVVQQNGDGIRRKMSVSEPGDPQEVEADQMARAVMQQEHAQTTERQLLTRKDDEDEPLAAKPAADALQRQPEASGMLEEDEKKLLTKRDATALSAPARAAFAAAAGTK